MKLENDPVNFHPSPPRKSYNPFDSDDDALDSPSLKSEIMYFTESGNGFDLKAFEKSSDTVVFHMDNGDFLWEESVLGQPATGDHSTNADSDTGLFPKEGQPYTDKNVTDCELPEFVICYKESNVKDIGIDEGVPSHEKLWVQSGEDEDKKPSTFLDLSSKTKDVMKIEESNDQHGALEASKSTLGSNWQKAPVLYTSEHPVSSDGLNEEALSGQYLVHEFGDDDLQKITELKLDIEDRVLPSDQTAIVGTASGGLVSNVAPHHHPRTEKETDKSPCLPDEPGLIDADGLNHDDGAMVNKGHDSSTGKVDNVDVIQASAATQSPSEHGGEIMSEESPEKDEPLLDSANAAAQESADTQDSKLAYNSKVESRSITFDFGSSTNSKPGEQEDEPQNSDVASAPTTQTMTRQEEGTSSSSILLARSEDRVHGETSFSSGMPVPLPSSITYSEPLTYSGSISLRSESSAGTGSTRSFAFPVLQTDWNTSPTRIGKGKKPTKKHRGWVQSFSCCKF